MGMRRYQITQIERALSRGLDEDALVEGRVTGRRNYADPLHDVSLAHNELELPGGLDRQIVAVEIARCRSFVRVQGVVVLAALHEIARVRKAELH